MSHKVQLGLYSFFFHFMFFFFLLIYKIFPEKTMRTSQNFFPGGGKLFHCAIKILNYVAFFLSSIYCANTKEAK